MDASRRGPICGIDNCRSRRYHEGDDGHEYCANGHRQSAVSQLLETEATAPGARKRKASRSEASASGDASESARDQEPHEQLEAYLQAFQLVLWKQTHWLLAHQGFPPTYEAVVKDLWTLRMRMLGPLLRPASTSSPSRLFSSQSEASESEHSAKGPSSLSKLRQHERAPPLVESLGLLYIAAVAMRLPLSIADLQAWASSGPGFPYLNAIAAVPRALRAVVPLRLRRKLYPRAGVADLAKLHKCTLRLVADFEAQCSMTFPAVNHPLLLYRLIAELGLPIDMHTATLRFARLLAMRFAWPPAGQKYVELARHPDVALAALLVVVVKLHYPFDDLPRRPPAAASPAALRVDWAAWNALYAAPGDDQGTAAVRAARHDATTEADVLDMGPAEMDDYLAWFQRMWLPDTVAGRGDDLGASQGASADFKNALWSMFPIDRAGAPPSAEQPQDGDLETTAAVDASSQALPPIRRRLRAVQASLLPTMPPNAADDSALADDDDSVAPELRSGAAHAHYRDAADLPALARPFHAKAAALAGLSVPELMLAVWRVELDLRRWVGAERARTKGKGKGKGKARGKVASDE